MMTFTDTARGGQNMSRRRRRKAEAMDLLARMDPQEVRTWIQEKPGAEEVLGALTFTRDEQLARRAVQALGWAARVRSEEDVEQVRDRIRRLIWSMNHESGNLVWRAPEMIGEMIVGVPQLASEYTRVLASFINLEPFEGGVHGAVARIATVDPSAVEYLTPYLESVTASPDPLIRVCAALALARIDPSRVESVLASLGEDETSVQFYDQESHELFTTTVGGAISHALGPWRDVG